MSKSKGKIFYSNATQLIFCFFNNILQSELENINKNNNRKMHNHKYTVVRCVLCLQFCTVPNDMINDLLEK
ncbi:hypothetical protein T01_1511 [Trichinella spiralis]|uniref:Uncharacterized protein n=1 Tax=Trichinella spiralis TaxID=6334 RepID=A0A0V1AR23_TRISP|nr:hypothetical protein T01_1511 [Trichinella spiralis]